MPSRETPLFTFAVVTDTHIRPPEGDNSSPWKVNDKANGRARYVTERLRACSPDFVIHVGDMVHPVPDLPSYGSACKYALELYGSLDFPVHYLPGNHDIGDKPLAGLPADPISQEAVEAYDSYFGKSYSSFEHGDCQFILLNAEAINSGLPIESEQKKWLEQLLGNTPGMRRFVFIHYPPYLHQPDEESYYDNLDEPGRSWLLALLQDAGVETMFSGHVHHYFHHWLNGLESYILPAVCFTRQDYAEMFRVGPAEGAEHGRDDCHKLAFALVDVYPDRNVVRFERTHGRELEEGEKLPPKGNMVRTNHPKDNMPAPLGLHMRHPWTEVVTCPHTPNDEFVRKRIRNDYPFMALQEMGVRLLRVPFSDLAEDYSRDRMVALHGMGVKFLVFIFNEPTDRHIEVLAKHGDLVDAVELIYDWRYSVDMGRAVQNLKNKTGLTVHASRLESGREQKARAQLGDESSHFSHFISTGFSAGEWDSIDTFLNTVEDAKSVDGFGFRLGFHRALWHDIAEIDNCSRERGLKSSVFVKLSDENPADDMTDERISTNRVAEAMVASFAVPGVQVYLDTFGDMDRGYFPRIGLYDRRFNPRRSSHVYRHLQSYLANLQEPVELGDFTDVNGGHIGTFDVNGCGHTLLLPCEQQSQVADLVKQATGAAGIKLWINLVSGSIHSAAQSDEETKTQIQQSIELHHPVLLIAHSVPKNPMIEGWLAVGSQASKINRAINAQE